VFDVVVIVCDRQRCGDMRFELPEFVIANFHFDLNQLDDKGAAVYRFL
jgi:hypothetical protein